MKSISKKRALLFLAVMFSASSVTADYICFECTSDGNGNVTCKCCLKSPSGNPPVRP